MDDHDNEREPQENEDALEARAEAAQEDEMDEVVGDDTTKGDVLNMVGHND